MNKRILVLGNNTEDTDHRTTALANKSTSINHGLFDILNYDKVGYYHTTLVDNTYGEILNVSNEFDCVIMLDQPASEWTSQKILLSTYKLIQEIEKTSTTEVIYKQNNNIKNLHSWQDYFVKNKSFCIYPWILYNDDQGYMTTCARSNTKITDISSDLDWKNDVNYNNIRKRMLDGEKLPEFCSVCYDYESKGLTGYRTHDSMDFISQIEIETLDDLNNITSPYYYEIRLSNKCNLMCRMCTPMHSHLIKDEFDIHPELIIGKPDFNKIKYTNIDVVKIDELTPKHTVYFTGGEPTVMKELYEFMQRCIDANRTDFQLTMSSNVQYVSDKLLKLGKHFTNLHFSVSIDGYGKINDYVRWLSNFETVMDNVERLVKNGHRISWNHVPTIWGIHKTHKLFEYVSEKYPFVPLYLQYNRSDLNDAYKSPLIEETIESMQRCTETKVYHNDGKDCKSGINSFLKHYKQAKIDKQHLKKFFEYNDKMDRARNINLKDYIPELDATRRYLE